MIPETIREHLRKLKHKNKRSWFDALSTRPVSSDLGLDRGQPIDRYYIEKFLKNQKHLVRGECLEVGDSTYTKKYGGNRVNKPLVLHVWRDSGADIIANQATGEGIVDNVADVFICTQTLPFLPNTRESARNAIRLLKPGGTLLLTVPGITQISRGDMEKWGQYWSFTDLAIKTLFQEFVPAENIKVTTYGNVKSAVGLLLGLASHEVSPQDLDYHDPNYQVIIAAVIRKP